MKTHATANARLTLSQHCPFRCTSYPVFSYNNYFNPFYKQQDSESSKLKEVADDNFKFDENGRNFSKWVQNTEGKGEIAHYEQFLLFPQCFQKTCTADT